MGKWLILYSSITGNTKMIAEQIAESTGEADLFSVDEMPKDLSVYEAIAIGYWLRRGGPDPKAAKALPKVQHATVMLFQTHGTDPGSEHAVTAYARAAYLLGEGCEILGTFGCQGKINPALIEKRRNASPDDPHGGTEAMERWSRAASHPDTQDLADAAEFVSQMKHKLHLRQKYRQEKT